MPPIETYGRFQRAVLWRLTGTDAYGEPTRGEAEEIDIRVEFGRRQALDQSGNRIMIDAVGVVDNEIPLRSTIWLGELVDWVGTGPGGSETEVMEVRTYEAIPDIDCKEVRREIGLAFFRTTLPQYREGS
jgi:hypothetical protein